MGPALGFRWASCRGGQNQTSLGIIGPVVSVTHTWAEKKGVQKRNESYKESRGIRRFQWAIQGCGSSDSRIESVIEEGKKELYLRRVDMCEYIIS